MEDYVQQIVDRGVPFEDGEFPKYSEINDITNFEWKRVGSVYKDAEMLSAEKDQLIQGNIPDCYLITALTVVSSRPDLLRKLILTPEVNKCGIYAFQFFHSYDNEWKKIIVDDYIPFRGNNPLFARFYKKKNIIWPMLLEKAYGKLYGGYNNIAGGNVSETLLDLTGCPVEDFVLGKVDLKCSQMKKWLALGFLVACALVTPNPRYDHIMDGNRSIIKNHAYSIEKVIIKNKKGYIQIKNPIGGDNHTFSKLVGTKISQSEPTGLIWLSYQQFLKEFNRVYCCKTSQNVQERFFAPRVTWTGEVSRIFRNPIFKVRNTGEKDCRVAVTISQKSKRHEKIMEHKLSYDLIGYYVVKPTKNMGKGIPGTICLTYGDYTIVHKTSLWNKRDVSSGFPMKKRSVCYLVPINHNDNAARQQSTFSLRIDCREENIDVERMIPFTNPSTFVREKEAEETEGETEEIHSISEKLLVKKKFSPKCGQIGDSVVRNPKAFIFVKEKCSMYVYLCQKKKPFDGVGIFVLKNTIKTNVTSTSSILEKKGFTNPMDLGLEVNVSEPCVLMIVFAPFKRSGKEVEMRVVADWRKVEAYETKEELLEKRKEEVDKFCAQSGNNSPKRPRLRGRARGRNKNNKKATRGGRTRGRGRATTRGAGRRGGSGGRGAARGVARMGGTAGMMANLYGGLE